MIESVFLMVKPQFVQVHASYQRPRLVTQALKAANEAWLLMPPPESKRWKTWRVCWKISLSVIYIYYLYLYVQLYLYYYICRSVCII